MKIQAALSIGLTLTMLSACKYDEGPAISLQTKKSRMANDWTFEEVTDDGEDVTSSYDQFNLDMSKDGDASLTAKYAWGDLSLETETDGTWEFDDKKETLVLDFEDDDADGTYQILRLTSDELWLREKGQDREIKLKGNE